MAKLRKFIFNVWLNESGPHLVDGWASSLQAAEEKVKRKAKGASIQKEDGSIILGWDKATEIRIELVA